MASGLGAIVFLLASAAAAIGFFCRLHPNEGVGGRGDCVTALCNTVCSSLSSSSSSLCLHLDRLQSGKGERSRG